jgi:hypothetical protein
MSEVGLKKGDKCVFNDPDLSQPFRPGDIVELVSDKESSGTEEGCLCYWKQVGSEWTHGVFLHRFRPISPEPKNMTPCVEKELPKSNPIKEAKSFIKNTMNNVTSSIALAYHRLTLSEDDRMMQEMELETPEGVATVQGMDLALSVWYREFRPKAIEAAKALKADKDKEKGKKKE